MFQSQVINRKLKTEFSKVTPTVRMMKELQRSNEHKNYSFEYPSTYDQLPKKLRCQSTYSKLCGFRSQKYQLFHDVVSEFAEHKKQRLANVIIQNLSNHSCIKDPQKNLTSHPRARLWTKHQSQLQPIHEESQRFQNLRIERHHPNPIVFIPTFKPSSIHENMPLTRQPSIEQAFDTKQTITLSCSRKQSPKMLFKPQQFILKSKFKTNNALEKILTEARNQIKTSQSPRSVHISQHKKTKSHPTNVYTEQNKLLQRVILKTKLNQ
ncbi:unnamed protein product (macronuclear) [Paramecium tetraurelia]|uniref:Uncharacterized protein n=1 Tax=Paramecium tetraurelia TaxID=5888 RepID=A0E9N2_PARTE|nr:uncharacterized protein GSPATT00024730001 [Paramecium tetraurelia]CAK91999.1 unnamed protein product [Paramecium tetraurelia]|eukprot:XP_001459396.1 hypothetical protein (macronuclear) [Paramecium tetraurelia strain d4-2]